MSKTLTLTDNETGRSAELPVLEPTYGIPVIDISGVPREIGCFTHDPGYGATSACRSSITYIDGDEGILLYRGYPIEQLAEKSSFLEVCYLLIYGSCPGRPSGRSSRRTSASTPWSTRGFARSLPDTAAAPTRWR